MKSSASIFQGCNPFRSCSSTAKDSCKQIQYTNITIVNKDGPSTAKDSCKQFQYTNITIVNKDGPSTAKDSCKQFQYTNITIVNKDGPSTAKDSCKQFQYTNITIINKDGPIFLGFLQHKYIFGLIHHSYINNKILILQNKQGMKWMKI